MTTGTLRFGAVTALILAGAVAGCSDDPVAPTDAGQDVGFTDTGVTDNGVRPDTGTDAGRDAGTDSGTPIDMPQTPDVPVTTDVPVDAPPSAIPGAPVVLTRNASFSTPLTVVLTASGATSYFTARTPAGAAALFRSAGAGATPTAVPITGVALVFPTGMAISADDNRLYIADQAANRAMTNTGTEEGALISVPTEGGAATALNIGTLRRPRGVAAHGSPEQLTFIAVQDDGTPVVARMAATGGTVTVLAMGGGTSPLRDPSAVAVAADGTAYVTDGRADSGLGAVFRIPMGGAPARIVGRLHMGLPAGIALSRDERRLLVAGWDVETGPGRLTWVGVDGMGAMSPMALGAPLTSPVGIARARNADIYGIADDTATDMAAASFGAVFTAR
jgi:sugar lactone lactonase YvrE